MILGLEKFALYFPERALHTTPLADGLAYEDVRFPAADGRMLHGWFVPAAGARFTICWFHGNAGNISHRVHQLGYLHRRFGLNTFLFDYRGYGQSEGWRFSLSERATYRDATGALAYLQRRSDVDPHRIIYFGQSLGAAVAVEMSRRRPPAGLVIETTFSTLKDVAQIHYPYVPLWLLQTKYETVSKLPELRVPLLILHGDQDEVVPLALAERLYAAARDPKTLAVVHGAHHNDIYIVGNAEYFSAWEHFLKSLETRAALV